MLQPKTMTRLLIVGSKEQMSSAVTELYRHHVFHITDYTDQGAEGYEGFRIGQPMAGATELSTNLISIRSIENTFDISPDAYIGIPKRHSASIREIIERDLSRIESEVSDLTAKRSGAEAQIRIYEQRIAELTPFLSIPLELGLYRGYESISVIAGKTSRDIEIPVPCEKFFAAGKGGGVLVLFFRNQDKTEVDAVLSETPFQQISIPEEEGSVRQRLDYYQSEISRLNATIADCDALLEEIKEKNGTFLAACDEALSAEVEQAEVPLRFATTDLVFVADGWVPSEEIEGLKSGLSQATGGRILVMEVDEKEEEEEHAPPVEYENPKFAKPTEAIVDIYSRPRYDELDPTLMISIIFPLFFGIILGDIAYGGILLVLALALRRMLVGDTVQRLLAVLRNASISAIFFGIVYAEAFGAHPGAIDIHLWEPIISRHLLIGSHAYYQADITVLLVFAVWFGILQMTLGRAMSVVNHYRHQHMSHVAGQIGWIALMWGVLFIIWSIAALPLMPDLTGLPAIAMGLNIAGIAGAVLVVLGLIGIARESPLELIEIPSIISHSLSYTRLAAVGLSSVAIAMVVNFIAIEMLIEPQLGELTVLGIVFVIFGILVLLLGHLLNTALGLLGGGLQSLRLQYVEFFTKFYKGGGEIYRPFGKKRELTED
ncbi:MAG: V-type ATP synthase subunit I [Methanocalculus sp. MSAO_Arc1]|uniref:V-type ATP synthase subunit I n=1 Tax=Methanocalculus TaxID=71151 RepID=UPI000FF1524E|nr:MULTISPECIES: V-type ATP synthase subunit I [unclassified Methanocalculus]MCP1661379.1 V/A-type H+-transporting ATPase subunit I [Methanocalculus sp. AMF5]RQD79671.1 MAG: V-type ATP synthase subunit I [Methanocalculus sp. MSAO_Arc1]